MRYPPYSICILALTVPLILAGCASTPEPAPMPTLNPSGHQESTSEPVQEAEQEAEQAAVARKQRREVAMHALMLLQTAYRFGGKNPEAGLDCSGLVTLVYRNAAGIELAGNAAWMAQQGRPVERTALRTGDLVFFNTLNRPFSHVGIYLGRGEFIHAPNSRGRVRIDRMDNRYYAARFEAARTFFD